MRKTILLFAFFPFLSFAQTKPEENVVTVVGISNKDVEPDWIQLGMSAKENENTRNRGKIVSMENSILRFIVSLGLDSASFAIDRYAANERYTKYSWASFKLNKSYQLKIEKIDLLDTIVAKCFSSGMDYIHVDQIGHSAIDSLQHVLLSEALLSAKAKAQLIASTMGIKLENVKSVNETYQVTNNQVDPEYFSAIELQPVLAGYGGHKLRNQIASSLSFQKIRLTKTVIVKYQVQ